MSRPSRKSRFTHRLHGRRLGALRTLAILAALLVASLAGAGGAAAAQLAAPTDLQITPGVGTLGTSWGVTSTSGLAGFRVRWRSLSASNHSWSKSVELGAVARSYAITGLSLGIYEIRVRTMIGKTRRTGAGHQDPRQAARSPHLGRRDDDHRRR